MKYSVVIPVYKNEETIPRLIQALTETNLKLYGKLEAVFVVDGSPDNSFLLLKDLLDGLDFSAQLLVHSRNFGSFAAIRTGLEAARGEYFAVLAADLQEPPELLLEFYESLESGECDVVVGTRNSRKDPLMTRISSSLFWGLYRRFVVRDIPKGGVDVFGCNLEFRNQLLNLKESRSSLIALIFWLGFRRKFIGYERKVRQEGKSSWSLNKKIDYMMDSIFAFTDLPIRLLIQMGAAGLVLSIMLGLLVIWGRLTGDISIPGYAATIVVVLFFSTLNLLGLGLVGMYAWRSYENSKQRPLAIVSYKKVNNRNNYEK